MKAKFTLIFLTMAVTISNAQWSGSPGNIYYTSGNVGIGTSNPAYFNLDILDQSRHEAGLHASTTLGGNSGFSLVAYTSGYSQVPSYSNKVVLQTLDNPIVLSAFGMNSNNQIQFYTGGRTEAYKRMVLNENGNLGIGTANPQFFKLDILEVDRNEAGIQSKTTLGGNSSFSLVAYTSNYSQVASYSNKVVLQTFDNPIVFSAFGANSNNQIQFYTGGRTEAHKRMVLDENGNLGIGATNRDAKLTVAGDIHSREIRVTVDAGADFVFEDGYDLKNLYEVEQFVEKNKHLPDIESAEEMEQNGLELGKMDIKLLRKIEELTRYMIEFKKEMDNVKEENWKLKEQIEALKRH